MRITRWKCKPCAAAWLAARRRRRNGMALTLADARARVETDLDDSVVQRILDAAVEEVNEWTGDPTSQTEQHRAMGSRKISLNRKTQTITSVTERRHESDPDDDVVTLSPNDYRQFGYELIRMGGGDNPASCWGAEVVVSYTPEIDVELRDRVTLDLVQLDVEFRAYEREEEGDWEGWQGDYRDRRAALIDQIREGRSPVL